MIKKYSLIALALLGSYSLGDAPKAEAATPSATAAGNATWNRRRALFNYNRNTPLNTRLVSRQVTSVSVVEKFTIRGAKGDTVPLYLVMPRNVAASTRVPVLVSVHGLLGTIDQMLPGAQLSAANGYATIIPEIVAHGERHQEGQDLLGGSIASLHDGIVETVGDIRRSIDFVVTRPRIDTNRVGYVGLSMGAIVGTITAAVDPRIKAVGLVVGGADWKLIIPSKINDVARQDREGNYGGTLLARAQSQLEDVDPKNYVGRIAPRPVLMLNGRRDNVIPPAASRVLFNAARNPKQQIWSDEGHFLQPNRVARILQTWFNQNLKTRRADNTSSTRLAVR